MDELRCFVKYILPDTTVSSAELKVYGTEVLRDPANTRKKALVETTSEDLQRSLDSNNVLERHLAIIVDGWRKYEKLYENALSEYISDQLGVKYYTKLRVRSDIDPRMKGLLYELLLYNSLQEESQRDVDVYLSQILEQEGWAEIPHFVALSKSNLGAASESIVAGIVSKSNIGVPRLIELLAENINAGESTIDQYFSGITRNQLSEGAISSPEFDHLAALTRQHPERLRSRTAHLARHLPYSAANNVVAEYIKEAATEEERKWAIGLLASKDSERFLATIPSFVAADKFEISSRLFAVNTAVDRLAPLAAAELLSKVVGDVETPSEVRIEGLKGYLDLLKDSADVQSRAAIQGEMTQAITPEVRPLLEQLDAKDRAELERYLPR